MTSKPSTNKEVCEEPRAIKREVYNVHSMFHHDPARLRSRQSWEIKCISKPLVCTRLKISLEDCMYTITPRRKNIEAMSCFPTQDDFGEASPMTEKSLRTVFSTFTLEVGFKRSRLCSLFSVRSFTTDHTDRLFLLLTRVVSY